MAATALKLCAVGRKIQPRDYFAIPYARGTLFRALAVSERLDNSERALRNWDRNRLITDS